MNKRKVAEGLLYLVKLNHLAVQGTQRGKEAESHCDGISPTNMLLIQENEKKSSSCQGLLECFAISYQCSPEFYV